MQPVLLEDETLRDGLQAESKVMGIDDKLTLFNLLRDAGVRRIQAGSFVHPKLVPQMADTDEFIKQLGSCDDVLITGLVLNGRGLERALKCGLKHLSMSVSISDAHSQKNTNQPAGQALESMCRLIESATASGVRVRAGAQCAFGCVYEGAIPEERVVAAAKAMFDAGAREINLADTTGMANPLQVRGLAARVSQALPEAILSLHLHDTRGLGLANMMAGYEAGVRLFDTAAGGLGGCPFVKGAAGNVATEDAAHLFEAIGADPGLDLAKLCRAVDFLEKTLGHGLPGRICPLNKVMKGAC